MWLKEVGVPSSTVLTRRAKNQSINVDAENPSGNQSGEYSRASKLEAYALALNSTNLTQLAYGIAANIAAVLLYGTNFVPVKRIELGDGESLSASYFR